MFRLTGLLLFAFSLSRATTIPRFTPEDLVAQSVQIVSGHVIRSWTSWGSEHRLIWTRTEIAIDSVLKGAPAKTIVVSEPGGDLEGQSMRVDGAVSYEPGEQVTLFLQSFPGGVLRTVGWSQGKFTLDRAGRLQGSIPELRGLHSAEIRSRISDLMRKADAK